MGNVFGVPFFYALNRIFRNESGFSVGIKEVTAYSQLEHHSSRQKKRLDLYKFITSNKWEENGIFIPQLEEDLEYRRPISVSDLQACDEIFFCGFNSSGEKLVAKISIDGEGLAAVWLYLKLSDGKGYILPQQGKLHRVPKTGPESFAAAGLRLKCLLPMRKWRIAFSGILEEISEDSEKTTFVKFSFTWSASSSIFDLYSDIPSSCIASFMSTQKWSSYSPDLQRLQENLDHYIQSGSMAGTVQVANEEEQEIYLWGGRKRSHETVVTLNPKIEYFGYIMNGEMIYFGEYGDADNNKKWLRYGFIVQSNSLGGPVDTCRIQRDAGERTKVDFVRENIPWYACFESPTVSLVLGDQHQKTSLQFCPLTLNCNYGNGLILSNLNESKPMIQKPAVYLPVLETSVIEPVPLVLSLCHQSSRHSEICGGKGSSLSELHFISGLNKSFSVPRGVAVTTKAYECFIKEAKLEGLLQVLQILSGSCHTEDFRKACERTCATLSLKYLPATIKDALEVELEKILGSDYQEIRMAVRSSASGEDSEEMSAAGQMTTYLGVKGIDEISKAVVKCWASQFGYIAAQYKRQNGQLLNSPMSVVVQKMVDAEVAGVMFTCDPVSGNPDHIVITANYGIGESVVSATAEPDTIILERKSLRIKSLQVGRKNIKTVMKDSGGMAEEQVPEDISAKCSLSEDLSIQLAKLGILVEEAYGCQLDIEWAIKGDNLYLLQARPVTTFDRDTDFEIMHEQDTAIRSEKEWYTIANVGEVLPGATSNLGLSTINKFIYEHTVIKTWGRRSPLMFPFSPYFVRGIGIFANHSLFNLFDVMLRFYHGEQTTATKSQMIGTFGRILNNEDMYKRAAIRNKLYPKVFAPSMAFYLIHDLVRCESHLKERTKKFWKFQINLNHVSTSEKMYHYILDSWISFSEPFVSHFECSFMSNVVNVVLFSLLISDSGDFSAEVYNDVAYILSSCSKVVSADIPFDIELLAKAISDDYGEGFHQLEDREALIWLERSDSSATVKFLQFLEKHGHRCVKEVDLYSNPWGSDPIPLVKILKDMTVKVDKMCTTKSQVSTQDTIRNLKSTLSWKNWQLMKVAIPLCRKAVGLREESKSLLIRLVNSMRKAYRELGERMVLEGRLPDNQLIYFLDHYELLQLFRTRSPKLVQKAIRRKALFPKMDKMILPELMEGIPKPINFAAEPTLVEGSLLITGVPVSRGVARGRARVACSLTEAADIQDGEILIAFSTDIGWSPYFPMLKGVVTELGGLVSHGAVVAREYGLPCVISAEGVTQQFKTGDLVQIDGSRGTIQRIDE